MSRFSRSLVVETDTVDLKVNDDAPNMKVEEVKVEEVKVEDIKKIRDVPPNAIYGHNLKSISSYNKLRKGYKLSNQKSIFLNDIKTILKEFPADKHQYDDELLVEILNIAEGYFIYGNKNDREKAKQECIMDILLPYFRNDVELLLKTIAHVWHKVKKTNILKRSWSRFKNFFFK
jgi:hypothetical protein